MEAGTYYNIKNIVYKDGRKVATCDYIDSAREFALFLNQLRFYGFSRAVRVAHRAWERRLEIKPRKSLGES